MKKDVYREWYNFAGNYDIDLFGGMFTLKETFGHWEFELFSGILEEFMETFKVEDRRSPRPVATQEEGRYYLHVRSVEKGTFFGTLFLDEPMDLAKVVVSSICRSPWGYHMDTLEFGSEQFERELDGFDGVSNVDGEILGWGWW